MKTKKILLLLVCALFCLLLTNCEFGEEVKTNAATYTLDISQLSDEICIDNFSLSDIKINVKYESGLTGVVDVNSSMLSAEDNAKLRVAGKQTIVIRYKNLNEVVTINLVEKKDTPENPDHPEVPKTDLVVTYVDEAGYYKDAVGKSGNELKQALRVITSAGYVSVSYSSLNTYLAKTDASLTDPDNKILLFYTRKEISNKWDGGSTWNKEHVWPRSTGWFQMTGAGCDAHHIRAVDSAENSRRGNTPFGVGSGYYTPKDEVKGDIARILFYLLVRYSEADNYSITCVAQSMKMLLDWNRLDPVDDIERNRNEEVYKIQHNRNPFIDYSDYAYYIWDESYLEVSNTTVINNDTILVLYIPSNKKDLFFLKKGSFCY